MVKRSVSLLVLGMLCFVEICPARLQNPSALAPGAAMIEKNRPFFARLDASRPAERMVVRSLLYQTPEYLNSLNPASRDPLTYEEIAAFLNLLTDFQNMILQKYGHFEEQPFQARLWALFDRKARSPARNKGYITHRDFHDLVDIYSTFFRDLLLLRSDSEPFQYAGLGDKKIPPLRYKLQPVLPGAPVTIPFDLIPLEGITIHLKWRKPFTIRFTGLKGEERWWLSESGGRGRLSWPPVSSADKTVEKYFPRLKVRILFSRESIYGAFTPALTIIDEAKKRNAPVAFIERGRSNTAALPPMPHQGQFDLSL